MINLRSDLPTLSSLGTATGVVSSLVFLLYSNSEGITEIYNQPMFLWPVAIIILFWNSRMWLLTHRNLVDDDPVVFAIKDRGSLLTLLLVVLFMTMALFY